MSMNISVHVDQCAAARLGRAVPSTAIVSVTDDDLKYWPQEIRDLFATSLKPGDATKLSELCDLDYAGQRIDNRPLVVLSPTAAGIRAKLDTVLAEVQAFRAASAAREAKTVAEHAAKDAELASAPLEEVLIYSFHRPTEQAWQPKHVSYGLSRYFPLYSARIENELKPECERRNAEAVAEAERQKAEQEKAEADRVESLRQWALAYGSELTKARLEEGLESWQRSMIDDRAKLVNDYADSIVAAIPIEKGEEPEHDEYASEDRLSPTLAEIEALRTARANVPAGVTCKLIRETFKTRAVYYECGEQVSPEKKEFRTAIELKITHDFGTVARYITLA